MALLEYTQEDHAETIRGRVWTGPDLKQEGEFQIAVTREALPLYSGAGWAWSMKVEIGEKAATRTETEADHPYENLTWQEAVALAKTRVMELADELGAERERAEPPPAHQHNSEKETVMNHRDVNESPAPEGPAPERGRWQTFRERLEGWFSRFEEAPPKQDQSASLEGKPQSEPDPPRETKWPILSRAGAVSPGDTIEPAAGRWFTVVELGEAQEPPEDQAGIRPYGTRREPGEQWQTAYCRAATLPEIHAAQKAQREQAGEERRYDVSSPGPTEAAGGSFRVLHSNADAEQAAQHLPQSHEYRIDQIIDEDGPTDSYAVTARPLPPPAEVARDAGVAQRVGQIQDPARRAEAERLLRTIREEAAAREQPPARTQEVELER